MRSINLKTFRTLSERQELEKIKVRSFEKILFF